MTVLRALRKARGLRQEDLAQILSLDKSSISKYESSDVMPSPEVLASIADFFDVTVDYLLGRTTKTSSSQPSKKGVRIPVLGQIVAGIPLDAVEGILDYEEIDETLAATGQFFGLQVKGDSMEPYILAGDIVIVRKQETAQTGDIVIALVNGNEATVKRIKIRPEGVMLDPYNRNYETMFYSNEEVRKLPVMIIGRVIEIRRSV